MKGIGQMVVPYPFGLQNSVIFTVYDEFKERIYIERSILSNRPMSDTLDGRQQEAVHSPAHHNRYSKANDKHEARRQKRQKMKHAAKHYRMKHKDGHAQPTQPLQHPTTQILPHRTTLTHEKNISGSKTHQ